MSKGSIKGITIEIEGKTSGLVKALKSVDTELNKVDRALKEVDKALELDPGNIELVAQKEALLADKTKLTADRLEILKNVQKDALTQLEKGADVTTSQMAELSAEIVSTEKELKGLDADDAAKDMDDLGDGADEASTDLKKVDKASSDTSKGLKVLEGVGKAVSKALKAAFTVAAGAAGALVGAIGGGVKKLGEFAADSVQTGMDFDKSMSQVAATMNKSVDEIQDLRDFAQEMGRTTQFSASQAADALNYMALAGYSADQSMETLPTVLNLAAAGNIDLAKASDMVTDAQSALSLTMDETTEMVDQMAKASSITNTSVDQLGEGILKIGGTAQLMSGGTEELAQVLGLLADNGIKGAEGGTALRNMLLALANPTEKGADMLEKLGIKVYDSQGKMRAMSDIMSDFNKKFEKMTDKEKTQAIGAIFPKATIASVNALLNTSAERWEEVGNAISDAGGSAAQMAETQLDNLAGDITKFQSAYEGMQIAVSDMLNPMLRNLTQLGTEAVSAITTAFETGDFSQLPTKLGEMATQAMEIITQNATPLLETLTSVINSVLAAITQPEVMEQIITTINSIFTAISTTIFSPENVELMLAAVKVLLDTLIAGLMENLDPILETAIEIVDTLVNALIEPDTISKLFDAALTIIMKLVDALVNNLPQLVDVAVKTIMTLVKELLKPSLLKKLITAAIQIIKALAGGIADALPDLIPAAVSAIDTIVVTIIDNLPEILEAALKIILALVVGILKALPRLNEMTPHIIQAFGDALAELPNVLVELATGWGCSLIDNFVTGMFGAQETTLKPAVSEISDSVENGLDPNSEGSNYTKYGSDTINEFNSGLSSGKSTVSDTISNYEQMLKDDLTPDRDTTYSNGEKVIDDLTDGMTDKIDSQIAAIEKKKATTQEKTLVALTPDNDKTEKAGETVIIHLAKSWDDTTYVETQATKQSDAIANNITPTEDYVKKLGKSTSEYLATGLDSGSSEVEEQVKQANNSLKKMVPNNTDVMKWGNDLVSSLIAGIAKKEPDLIKKAKEIAKKIDDNLGFSVPEEGPLSKWGRNNPGVDMVDLFVDGMSSQMGVLEGALNKTANVIAGGMQPNYSSQLAGISGQLAGMNREQQIVIPVSIGNTNLDTAIAKMNNTQNYRSGGY